MATLEVTEDIEAGIGFVEGGGTKAVQIVIDPEDIRYLDVIEVKKLPD